MKTQLSPMNYNTENDQIKKHVGKVLREQRISRNYSLQAVADDLQMSKSTLSEIENGVYNFNFDMLAKIAAYYNIIMAQLFPKEA